MISVFQNDFLLLVPYIFFFFFSLLGLATFSGFSSSVVSSGNLSKQFSYFGLVGATLFAVLLNVSFPYTGSSGLFSFFSSPFTLLYANTILFGLAVCLVCFSASSIYSNLSSFEVPFFFLIATLASLLIVLSGDFLTIYLGLELQALCLYVLAASRTNSTYSVEAGLKYFVLGSFASCLLLFGFSTLYALTGTLSLFELQILVFSSEGLFLEAILFSSTLILIGFLFKVGAAPFHFWVPDVYAGSPVVVTTFFAMVPKVAAWVVLVKILLTLISPFSFFFSNFFNIVSILSLLVAAYGAVVQPSLKRLIAYSAIGQTGYLVLSIGTYSSEGLAANVFYLIVYSLTLAPIFILFSTLQQRYSEGVQIDSLSSLHFVYKYNPLVGFFLVLSFLSLAGIPPLSGFFSKLYIFYSVLVVNNVMLAVLALILSVVGSVYYLKIVRTAFSFKKKDSFLFFYDFSRPSAYVFVTTSVVSLLIPFWGSDLSYLIVTSFSAGVL